VQLTVTKQGQCAFVGLEQNTQIVLWQKLVVLKQCKTIADNLFLGYFNITTKLLLSIFLVYLQNLVIQSLPIGKHPTWKTYSQQIAVS
jgi:hypothetical protein